MMNLNDKDGQALITNSVRMSSTGMTSTRAIERKTYLAMDCRRSLRSSREVAAKRFSPAPPPGMLRPTVEREAGTPLSAGIPRALLVGSIILSPPHTLDDQVRRQVYHERE